MWDGSPITDETENTCRYVVVVASSDEPLYRYLQARLAGDTLTRVIIDRRRRGGSADGSSDPPGVERRLSRSMNSSFGVAVVRLSGDGPAKETTVHDLAGRRTRPTMEGIEGLEDRQRIDRWLEESQYLIGRMIPAYLDDRDRVRARLGSVEQDNERLRIELAEARRELAELRGDLEFHRAERARIAENFHTIVEQLTALQRPVNDISSRLQSAHSVAADATA